MIILSLCVLSTSSLHPSFFLHFFLSLITSRKDTLHCTTSTPVTWFLSIPSSFSESSHLSHIVRNTVTLSLPHCSRLLFLPLSFLSISHLFNPRLSCFLHDFTPLMFCCFLSGYFSSCPYILLLKLAEGNNRGLCKYDMS